jgi:hypothetical protein
MSYIGEDEPWLVDIRRRAQDLSNSDDWETYAAMESELRSDHKFWVGAWGPILVLARHHLGRQDARQLLEELIDGGFSQPEMLEPVLSQAFGDATDWPRLRERMRANIPEPPIEILDWPQPIFGPPQDYSRVEPSREALLREQLPEPADSAWDTALGLLAWVSRRWEHANDHVNPGVDAVEVLRRVDEDGKRFACVEYTLVLTQSLCARGIPARRVACDAANYHTGLSKGHAVTEAWIDELGTWVVLDGQNGMYWVGADDRPIGVRELQDSRSSGGTRPSHHCVGARKLNGDDAQLWWSHFHHMVVGGLSWATTYVPTFQDDHTVIARMVLHDRAEVRAVTRYGELAPQRVVYRLAR